MAEIDVSVKVAILAVGTELTSGEISNGNAVWLSERLEDLGFEVAFMWWFLITAS